VCISVNDEVVHGILEERTLRPGKPDWTAEKDGYHTDSAVTVQVSPASDQASSELVHCAERAFRQGLTAARAGNAVREIG
jgi:methionyl aminopeptidase